MDQAEIKYKSAQKFSEEVGESIDLIHDLVEDLKEKFTKSKKVDGCTILSKDLDVYFESCVFDKLKFKLALEYDLERLKANVDQTRK